MIDTSDAIVIGAGVTGISIAMHLAERRMKPTILERKFIASGATGRSSGLVRMHYDLEVEARLAWESFQYFRNWNERVGGESGFTRTGFLYIGPRQHAMGIRANVEMHQRIGIPSQIVTADEVKQLMPAIRTEDFDIAAYEPESGYADPTLAVNSMLSAARGWGARILQECQALEIITSGGKVRGVRTSKGELATPFVVNAAGPWAGSVGLMAGVDIPIDTWTHDVMYLRRPASIQTHLTVIDDALAMYFRPESGGLTLMALEDNSRIGESPDAAESVAADFVMSAVDRICRRMPELETGALHSTQSGRDGITPDQHPILCQAGPEGFYLACGFSGTGFKISPAVGACMSELILDGKARTVDISSLSLERFARGEYLRGKDDYGKIWS
jgi:sarcosine oxidase subunit beta